MATYELNKVCERCSKKIPDDFINPLCWDCYDLLTNKKVETPQEQPVVPPTPPTAKNGITEETYIERPEAEDKKSCQEIALRKWKADPSIRIAEMARDDKVRRDGNGGLYEEATVCRWLREVAPLGIRGRKGRPSKKSSQKTDETAK